VKTSLAPGSKVVTDYLTRPVCRPISISWAFNCRIRLHHVHRQQRPLPDDVAAEVRERALVVCSVLSGNRNFEGRIQQDVRANYLASPPLVVAYALVGTLNVDLTTEPLGTDRDGRPVIPKDVWPTGQEIQTDDARVGVRLTCSASQYAKVFDGADRWRALPVPKGDRFAWAADSTYIRGRRFWRICLRTRHRQPTSPRARARVAGRQHHHRSHFAGRIDQSGQPRRQIPGGARRGAEGLQFLRRPARQP
jgi:aconitate hydratase